MYKKYKFHTFCGKKQFRKMSVTGNFRFENNLKRVFSEANRNPLQNF